jgi:hypothetical protein
MLFPQLAPQYYDENHRGILAQMEAKYAESITINQSFWGEADTDTRFYTGDQTLWNDLYGNLPANRRKQFNFNRIMRTVNVIEGHQRRNRKSTIVIPIENGDADTADQFTKILMWVNQQEGVLETISDGFHGALITGMNLLHVWMDFRSDPVNGNIRVDNCSYNSFLIDPYFKKHDLSDCQFIWKRSFLTKRDCIALMPKYADEILGLMGNDSGTGRDGKFQFMPESYNYGYKNLLTYDEYYYRDYRTQKMLVDTQTGETMEWKSDDQDRLKLFLQTYPAVTVIENEIPTVRMAIVIQGKVFYDGPNVNGTDMYPFVPVMAYYEPELPYFPWRCTGVVRHLRDAQYLYNRRKVIELDILESQINSGFIYKESALINPKDVFLSGQGRGLALKEDAEMTDVQAIVAPQIPPSMIELSKILAQEVNEISGVNEELLGSATDEKAGVLAMLRQGAGLTTLQILFDRLDFSQKLLGKLMIDLIQTNFTPGKIKKILEDQEPSEQFYNKNFGTYHANVEEGLNTSTQKQMNFAQLLQLKEIGMNIPDTLLLEQSTIQNKKKLVEALEQAQQQQQQMQQQQSELQMAELQARIQSLQAKAIADQGLGIERASRVEENHSLAVEREAKAEADKDLGLLNLIRAMKEIDTVDIDQMHKIFEIKHGIEQQQMAQAQARNAERPQPNQTPQSPRR